VITEDQVRSALRQATDAAPMPKGIDLDTVRSGVRRRRRARLGAVTTVAAFVAGVLAVSVVRSGAPGPVLPVQPGPVADIGPRMQRTELLDGVELHIEGPLVITVGRTSTVTVEVTNRSGATWSGLLGAMVSEPNSSRDGNGNSSSLMPAPGQPQLNGSITFLPGDAARSLEGFVSTDRVTLAPGARATSVFRIDADPSIIGRDPLNGWIPYLIPDLGSGALARYPDPVAYPLITAVTGSATGPGLPLRTGNTYMRGDTAALHRSLVMVDLTNDGADPIRITAVASAGTGVTLRAGAVTSAQEKAALVAPMSVAFRTVESTAEVPVPARGSAALSIEVVADCSRQPPTNGATITVTYLVGADPHPRVLELPVSLDATGPWLPQATAVACPTR
jgi:hypothetical protein